MARANRPRRGRGCHSQALLLLCLFLVLGAAPDSRAGQKQNRQRAQAPSKLPSAEKIVDSYLKAIGGKKNVAAVRDATYVWTIQLEDQLMGLATTQTRAPSSVRTEMRFGNGEVISAATARSAWTRGLDGKLHTLTDAEAAAARLQAVLDAGRLVNVKKSNVLARVVSLRSDESGGAYVVEFSLRSGARLRYLFSLTSKLLIGIEDDARKTTTRFEDYRREGNVLEPHRMSLNTGDTGELTFLLQRVSYNTRHCRSEFRSAAGCGSVGCCGVAARSFAKSG